MNIGVRVADSVFLNSKGGRWEQMTQGEYLEVFPDVHFKSVAS